MNSAANRTISSPAVRRSARLNKKLDEAKANKAEEEKIKHSEEVKKVAKKRTIQKTTSKRKRAASTTTSDPENPGTATASDIAENTTTITTQNAAGRSSPAAVSKKQRTKSKKAAAAAAMTVPIPEDPSAAELADLIQVQSRLRRALSQRMYVVDRERKDAYTETFDVLGSIGNLYKVTVGPKLGCSCCDFRYRRSHCKHIFLILARVFHLTGESRAYQSLTLNYDELEVIFAYRTPDPSVLASEEIQQAINKKKEGKHVDTSKRRPLKDSDCPICYEELDDSDISQTVFCVTCGNNLHQSCFDKWSKSLRRQYQSVTCVFCRSEWVTSDAVKLKKNEEGFINFHEEAGLPMVRDTSTYRRR